MQQTTWLQRVATIVVLCLAASGLQAGLIHQAVRARDVVTLRRILETEDPDAVNSTERGGITALHLAAATDQAEAIDLLVAHGATVDQANDQGFTPLHWAAGRNAVHAIEALIKAGAEVDARTRNRLTPLHFAAHKQCYEAAKLLLACGANPEAETSQGYQPLHMAVKLDPKSALAHMLAEAIINAEPPEKEQPDLPAGQGDPAVERDDSPLKPKLAEPMNEAVPGTFLNVPLGLGEALAFVWVERLGIWFGKYEVTNGQVLRYQPRHSSRSCEGFSLDDPNQPAVYVSWNDATAFCQWLNQSYSNRIPKGTEFRLPTSEEWIYVASCGQLRQYPWGNEWPPRYGNYSDISAREQLSAWRGIDSYDDGHPVSCRVQDSGMNEWGVFGLAGNVWEWCEDWFDDTEKAKVRHGGSWDFDKKTSLEIAFRGFDRPTAHYDTIGFRVVVGPSLTPASLEPEAEPEQAERTSLLGR